MGQSSCPATTRLWAQFLASRKETQRKDGKIKTKGTYAEDKPFGHSNGNWLSRSQNITQFLAGGDGPHLGR